ncbi:MAG: protein kinase [Streptosporangiales bacterium]|nr:protein kinase [Streptosporangiales bacterium]
MLVADRYRVGDLLGRGGMGEVRRAVDESLGRPVALKLLPNQGGDDVRSARFQMEARTAARLNHPHVVMVYDFGVDRDHLFLVMELLSGRSLADELTDHTPMPIRRAAELGAQAAAGLAAAHAEGVVHRDVKPGNLLLTDTDEVKVGDFGIARFADESHAALTRTGQIIGTSLYLAPERARGMLAEPPADMYALGCVLYELVTGHPPFRADTPAAVLYQHVDASPEAPCHLRPDLPEEFDALILRLLAKDPEDRPTAAQAVDTLTAAGLTTGRSATREIGALGVQSPAETRWQRDPRLRRSRRVWMVAAGVVVLGAAAATLGTTLPDIGDDPPVPTRSSPAQQDTQRQPTAPGPGSAAATTAVATATATPTDRTSESPPSKKKSQQPNKPGKTDKPEKTEKTEKPDASDRPATSSNPATSSSGGAAETPAGE